MGNIRIISGKLRGRYIQSKDELGVRPLLGSIKKSLFDTLTPFLPNSIFLDLYAGFGSSGIEAVSRGASKAVFVEKNAACAKIIERNIELLGIRANCSVIQADVLCGLNVLFDKFDIVFMGPPYKDESKKMLYLTSTTLDIVAASNILKETTIVVSQRHVKELVVKPVGLELERTKKYGDTVIDFYKVVH